MSIANPKEQGLSPRMRGNPCKWDSSSDGVRSIPAYAGEPATYTAGV